MAAIDETSSIGFAEGSLRGLDVYSPSTSVRRKRYISKTRGVLTALDSASQSHRVHSKVNVFSGLDSVPL